MKRWLVYLILSMIVFCFSACSSSMMNFHSPVVKKSGEIKGAIMASSTSSVEIQTIVGLGYNFDASLKLSPFLPISILDKQISYPLDVDLKYQFMSVPFFLTGGTGWSSVINRRNTVELNKIDKNEHTRLYLLFGTEHFYGGIQSNYLHKNTTFVIGKNPVRVLPAQQYFINYILGASLGTSFRINPEVSFIHTKGTINTMWGMCLEFTGTYNP